ncbi:MAG TPA: 6-phosphogluconolactonase [bacterium]|nr:6-phosphogluconolactonase [bacterium]
MTLQVERLASPAAVAQAASGHLDAWARQAVQERGRFVLALAGGSTPRAAYQAWASQGRVDWSKGLLVFGDERCVPPDHPQSNHRMVQEALLAHLPRQPRVLRMPGEAADRAAAAQDYAAQLQIALGAGAQGAASRLPDGRLDMALLGMGEDGHTASLFPGQPALHEAERLCLAVRAPVGPAAEATPWRLTLTLPVLRGARQVLFLVCGRDKAAVVQRVLHGPLEPESLPAQFFLRDGRVDSTLLLDEAAASAALD